MAPANLPAGDVLLLVVMLAVIAIACVMLIRGGGLHGALRMWRQRRLRTELARAEALLTACQRANENHPGLYKDLVAGATADVTKLRHRIDAMDGPRRSGDQPKERRARS